MSTEENQLHRGYLTRPPAARIAHRAVLGLAYLSLVILAVLIVLHVPSLVPSVAAAVMGLSAIGGMIGGVLGSTRWEWACILPAATGLLVAGVYLSQLLLIWFVLSLTGWMFCRYLVLFTLVREQAALREALENLDAEG